MKTPKIICIKFQKSEKRNLGLGEMVQGEDIIYGQDARYLVPSNSSRRQIALDNHEQGHILA